MEHVAVLVLRDQGDEADNRIFIGILSRANIPITDSIDIDNSISIFVLMDISAHSLIAGENGVLAPREEHA